MSDEKKTSMVGKFGEGKGNPTAYKNSGLAGMNPPNPTELRERMTFLHRGLIWSSRNLRH